MTRRAAIVLPSGTDVWRVANLTEGFIRVAEELTRDGFAVELIVPPDAGGPRATARITGLTATRLAFTHPPILAGPGPAHLSASLRLGYQLWRRLAADPVDIVLAPLVGGVLQPSLLSREIGESMDATALVAWGEATTARRVDLGDIEPAGVGEVIDDALEATTLGLVDAVVGARDFDSQPRHVRLAFPARSAPSTVAAAPFIDEIVFVGPASRRHGASAFLAEIERLGHGGKLAGRRVTFLGPWREGPRGLGKAMLGRRARSWDFVFTQIDETDLGRILERLCRPGVLAVFAGAAADDDVLLTDAAAAGAAIAVCAHHPLAGLCDVDILCAPDLADLERLFEPTGRSQAPAEMTAGDWAAAFESLIVDRQKRLAPSSPRLPSASLCITHSNRPAELEAALESRGTAVGPGLETVIVDTGSDADTRDLVAQLRSSDIRILDGPAGARQAWARNLGVEQSSGEILVFLDDDNWFIDGGLRRLLAPFVIADVDLVVSTLSLHDSAPSECGAPSAELAFMGRAGAAGLLYNGFGDANFAIRRNRFVQLGGFADNDEAAFDWVFLAKAQAAGLRIDVLQKPAIGYRRDLSGRDSKWRKHDLEGPRSRVLGAYALARSSVTFYALVQTLALSLIE